MRLPRFLSKGEIGQSIIILALGFIGLVAVVGITTDVSILFARYAQLRRAVDSASIAAAGQLRQDSDLATVGLTARQFVEFHGLNPRRVWVETCENPPVEDEDPVTAGIQIAGNPPLWEVDPDICTEDQRKLIRVTAQVDSPTVFLRLIGFGNVQLQASAISETAVLDVVIVLDVSESMLNETTYADWAEVNQGRAYIPPRIDEKVNFWPAANPPDTILYRMSDQNPDAYAASNPTPIPTILDTAVTPEERVVDFLTVPPQVDDPGDPGRPYLPQTWWEDWFWQIHFLSTPQQEINDRLWYPGAPGEPATMADQETLLRTPTDPVNPYYEVQSFIPSDVQERISDGEVSATQGHARRDCRVKFYPYSTIVDVPDYLLEIYNDNGTPWQDPEGKWAGFVPTFDFYGCCNDPGNGQVQQDGTITPGNSNGDDGDFSDLVCQPFKQARDATRLFLDRIDFLRGDRVSFVTFDRSAYIIDPDGISGPLNHMIEDQALAEQVLNRNVGVRAEPNFYSWDDGSGNLLTGWFYDSGDGTGPRTQFSRGIDPNSGNSELINYQTIGPDTNIYPVRGHCEFQNSTMFYPFGKYTNRNLDPSDPEPNGIRSLRRIMTPDIYNASPWAGIRANPGSLPQYPDSGAAAWSPGENTYELWSQCRGTNVGAALREANNALADPQTTRTQGSVWVMILLSDGAAGASDPVRIRGRLPDQGFPYTPLEPNDPLKTPGAEARYGNRGEYGHYGLCPPGGLNQVTGQTVLGELMRTGEPSSGPSAEPNFPYCSDEQPVTRQFCTPTIAYELGGDSSVGGAPNPNAATDVGFGPNSFDNEYLPVASDPTATELQVEQRIYDVDIGEYGQVDSGPGPGSCSMLYDVDDYARDWADFVGGIGQAILTDPESIQNDAVLPTIFTIGFGLNFENGDGSCDDNIEDCLGEELLRYIADVGDNFRIDTDYQQDWRDDGTLGTDPAFLDYGQPDPCQPDPDDWTYDPVAAAISPENIELREAGESCGNYYNAPGQAELQQVFDDIAARMFTRLAG